MRAEDLLLRIWRDRNVAALALLPLAWLYGTAWRLRCGLLRLGWLQRTSMAVPVIVVGNVVTGGAGKTPLVIELVRQLARRGLRAAVISRGHARRAGEVLQVTGQTDVRDGGDEPVLIARRTQVPVFVGRDRARAARALLQACPGVDVIVSDDGLQHLQLARRIEICVFDERGLGNGFVLPAGPLREPWPRVGAASDAAHQWVVFSAWAHRTASAVPPGISPTVTVLRRLAGQAIRADGSRCALADLAPQSCVAVAAIAHPERFFSMLRAVGLMLQHTVALPDHDPLDRLPAIVQQAPVLLCTEKDAVKLWRSRPDAWSVALELEIPDAFVDDIVQAMGPPLSSRDGHKTA